MGFTVNYNPDILSCLANLSNDEVFTPPELVNRILDMLPAELWSDPNTRVLDPCSKSGVFLREIAKRMIDGEKDVIPDLQDRIDHIFHKQLYGIAITELTSLLSRRSLYCSKMANGQYSVSHFKTPGGNIIYRRRQHTWDGDKCIYCGASKTEYDRSSDLESHAYEFTHLTDKETKELSDMHFDLIIGNPPYQLSDGGGTGSSAIPIYKDFIIQAKKLNPTYISMIIPSRWFSGGKGLDDFRDEMLHDNSISVLVDYFDSNDCFPGIDLSGGVCYFLRDKNYHGDCEITNINKGESITIKRPLLESKANTFVRFNKAINIFRKVVNKDFTSFETIVSARNPFGNINVDKTRKEGILTYAYPEKGWIDKALIKQNVQAINQYKVFISKAYGERGSFPYFVTAKPFIGEPGTCSTGTYLMIGPCENKTEAENIISYISTRFFRFFVLLKKNTQNAPKGVYAYVPMLDFSKSWTDEELYKKYELTDDEIAFIESMIRPMDSSDKEA